MREGLFSGSRGARGKRPANEVDEFIPGRDRPGPRYPAAPRRSDCWIAARHCWNESVRLRPGTYRRGATPGRESVPAAPPKATSSPSAPVDQKLRDSGRNHPLSGSIAGRPLASRIAPSEPRNRYCLMLPGQWMLPAARKTARYSLSPFRSRLKSSTGTVAAVKLVCVSRMDVATLVSATRSEAPSSVVKYAPPPLAAVAASSGSSVVKPTTWVTTPCWPGLAGSRSAANR